MTTVRFKKGELERLLGKKMSEEEILNSLAEIGTDPEKEGEEIVVEVYPNRPDMYSVEGIARALRSFLEISPGLWRIECAPPKIEVEVDPSVKEVRPYIVGGVVRGVKLDEEAIESLMRLQENLHESYGRKRKKVAIGIHDLDKVVPPFKYSTVEPEGIKFVPLGFSEEMTPREILEKHPKGKEYGEIIKGKRRYPILLDSKGRVLSMPPIINGELTKVTDETRNLFIDVTGTHFDAVEGALEIVMGAIYERGGKLERVKVIYPEGSRETPFLGVLEKRVNMREIEETLGKKFSKDEVKRALERMGYEVSFDGKHLIARYLSIRRDIMHEVDIIEDVAIGYGYERLGEELPKEYKAGEPHREEEEFKLIRKILTGLGFIEIKTFILSGEEEQFDKMRINRKRTARVLNPISQTMNVTRVSLIPGILEAFSRNSSEELPIKLFEVGYVVDEKYENLPMVAFGVMDTKVSFSDIRRYVEAFFRYYLRDIKEKYEMKDDPRFIPGRSVKIKLGEEEIGIYGEVHPEVLENFKIEYPVVMCEINLKKCVKALKHPL